MLRLVTPASAAETTAASASIAPPMARNFSWSSLPGVLHWPALDSAGRPAWWRLRGGSRQPIRQGSLPGPTACAGDRAGDGCSSVVDLAIARKISCRTKHNQLRIMFDKLSIYTNNSLHVHFLFRYFCAFHRYSERPMNKAASLWENIFGAPMRSALSHLSVALRCGSPAIPQGDEG